MKKIIITILLLMITYLFLMLACGRVEQIENNPKAYDNQSVKIFKNN